MSSIEFDYFLYLANAGWWSFQLKNFISLGGIFRSTFDQVDGIEEKVGGYRLKIKR